jgi:hypothetical protein
MTLVSRVAGLSRDRSDSCADALERRRPVGLRVSRSRDDHDAGERVGRLAVGVDDQTTGVGHWTGEIVAHVTQ